MDFSIKGLADISTLMAEEIGKQIEAGSIQDLQVLENHIRVMLKEVGQSTYQKVLESEDGKQGKRIEYTCRGQVQRISKREAKLLTVFGWVCYCRSYYGCKRCGEKQSWLDQK